MVAGLPKGVKRNPATPSGWLVPYSYARRDKKVVYGLGVPTIRRAMAIHRLACTCFPAR